MARVADAVRELSLETDVAGGCELYAGGAVHLIASPDRLLQHCDFILLTSAPIRARYYTCFTCAN